MSFISRLIYPSKLIREKYPNLPKTHKLENLVLIAESENKRMRNISVRIIYTYLHAYFGAVEFTPQGDMLI